MSYGWIITHDYAEFDDSDVGIIGPKDVKFTKEQLLKGKAFKMKDGDGNLVYRGRITGDYDGFEPLDDFGEGNAGCTEIWYFLNGKWKEQ